MTETRTRQPKTAIVLTAAGNSTRMGKNCKKEFMDMPHGKGTVLSAAAVSFFSAINPDAIVVTFQQGSGESGKNAAKEAFFSNDILKTIFDPSQQTPSPSLLFVEGGATRQESVFKALSALEQQQPDIVLIHDGARPFVTKEIIQSLWKDVQKYGAATCGLQPVDTQKEIDSEGKIIKHLMRTNLCSVQTPQGFVFSTLLQAHKKAANDGCSYTDDTEIWSKYALSPVYITQGSPDNKKITFPTDLKKQQSETMKIRTGLGYDLHRLESGRKLIIGGIEIPFNKGEVGHSDGDVLLHAVTDALLGAAALADIGELFPPSDEKWKNADSKQLLQSAWNLVKKDGWDLCNLDCMVKLEQPKLLPYRKKIIQSISNLLGVLPEKVFVKAKTAEGLECVGNGEAIEAFASCLLFQNN